MNKNFNLYNDTGSPILNENYEAINTLVTNAMILFLEINITIGVVGNVLNLMVFSRRTMRHISTFRFLLYLALTDLLVLVFCASDVILKFGYQIEIRSYSTLICKFHTFLTYFLTHSSSIILMVISIDRALVISHKSISNFFYTKDKSYLKRKSRYNHSKIMKKKMSIFDRVNNDMHRVDLAVGVIAFALFLLNFHYLVFLNLNILTYSDTANENSSQHSNHTLKHVNISKSMDENLEYVCFPVIGTWYSSFLMNIWIWIDFFVYSIIPFIVMGICSMIIIVKIQRNSNNLLKTLSKTSQSDKTNLQRRLKRNRQLLYMLLITNLYFLISLLPCCISFLIFGGSETKSSLHQLVVHILLYTNNSINFLFYGFSSEKYRKEFIGFFKSKKEKASKALSYYVEP